MASGEKYDRAVTLMQYEAQLFWLVYGGFLLTETVLIAATCSTASSSPGMAFAGAILGLVIAVPWWASAKYRHAFFVLRMAQARAHEAPQSDFLAEGRELSRGNTVREKLQLPWLVLALGPWRAVSLLIAVFAVAFLSLAIAYRPHWACDPMTPNPPMQPTGSAGG